MAATANSNLSSSSPSLSSSSTAATLSPRSLPVTRTGSPPWTQIVRGQDSEATGAPSSPSVVGERICSPSPEIPAENSDNGGNVGGKKLAWNKKLPNGPVENGGPGPVVMGPAEAWPALSESTKASPKLSSSDSSKNLPDFGSVSSSQVTGTESPTLSIAPSVQSQSQLQLQSSSIYQKPTTSNSNHNPVPHHGRTARQKSMKRDGGGNPQANGGFSHQASSAAEGPHSFNHSSTKSSSGGGFDSSGRDGNQNHGHRDSGSRNASGDHSQPRNSFRRGTGGSHSRGDGYGGRRGDQDRGNHEWNQQRSFNGRDATMQARVSPRNFGRSSTIGSVAPSFVHHAVARPFMNNLGIAELPMGYYVHHMPFVPPPTPLFVHPVQDPLHAKIVGQIDYYFSNENLIKDTFLRQFMDEHGWVPISTIASFNKVKILTDNIQQILEALRSSTVVEVQGDKIRKRDDWMRWVMPPSVQFPTASSSQSPKSPTIATLSTHIQNVKVDEKTIDQNHPNLDVNAASVLRSSSGDLNSAVQTSKDGAGSSGH